MSPFLILALIIIALSFIVWAGRRSRYDAASSMYRDELLERINAVEYGEARNRVIALLSPIAKSGQEEQRLSGELPESLRDFFETVGPGTFEFSDGEVDIHLPGELEETYGMTSRHGTAIGLADGGHTVFLLADSDGGICELDAVELDAEVRIDKFQSIWHCLLYHHEPCNDDNPSSD